MYSTYGPWDAVEPPHVSCVSGAACLTGHVKVEVQCGVVAVPITKETCGMANAWSEPTRYTRGLGSNFKPLVKREYQEGRIGDIASMDAKAFMDAVVLAWTAGLGLLISPTRDGGALSIIIYTGEDPLKTFANDAASFRDAIAAVRDEAEAKLIGGTTQPPKTRVRGS